MTRAAAPERYAVLGNPVAHSRSPFIHAEFARQTGEPVEYGRVLCPHDGFEAAVRAFAAGGAKGCNVTVPFKFDAPRLAARVTARAALAQAANTLRFDADGWHADNTDGIGLVNDIVNGARVPVEGTRVLLVGAGGAAAGALGPMLAERPAEVVVANRTRARAEALVARHASQAGSCRLRAGDPSDPGEAFDIVVNASASSLAGDTPPVAARALRAGTLALDMMYGPAAEPFVRWATLRGAVGRDGLGMLVEQAAEAFFFWRGVRPATPPVLEALRRHLAEAA